MRKAREVKATVVFREPCFTLHKWTSNALELEADQSSAKDEEEITYAKQKVGRPTRKHVKNTRFRHSQRRVVPTEQARLTKRGILAKLAKIYDPAGLISPETLSWQADLSRRLRFEESLGYGTIT